MKKNIPLIVVSAALVILLGVGAYFILSLNSSLEEQKAENEQMYELAELDRQEMEDEYARFAAQYDEMMKQITNDSLIAQLEREQQRTQELMEELRNVKATDAAEIMRLKQELATLREILRGYVQQIDSLNRLNQQLIAQNESQGQLIRQQEANITNISAEREALAGKVDKAAQLDATAIAMTALNKKDKTAKKIRDFKKFAVTFNISRNITAEAGTRTVYIRIITPGGTPLTQGGTFEYEGRNIEYTARKTIEYNGEETTVSMYYDIVETLQPGTYHLQIFADGNNIGNAQFAFNR